MVGIWKKKKKKDVYQMSHFVSNMLDRDADGHWLEICPLYSDLQR